jgi:hypothetical protein
MYYTLYTFVSASNGIRNTYIAYAPPPQKKNSMKVTTCGAKAWLEVNVKSSSGLQTGEMVICLTN